jgi:hypothetical protein
MKNLLVYISPVGFDKEREMLARVQIDNSLDLGWKLDDIILVTNFKYEYNGIRAIRVSDDNWYAERPRSIKTAIIPHLIDEGIVKRGTFYWNHDFDAYQLNTFYEEELRPGDFMMGLTDYGWRPRWCLGSFFFDTLTRDIFERAKPIIYQNIEDETAMMELCKDPEIAPRCKRLNITYNFGMRHVEENYERADKPIRVVHFHPWYPLVKTLDIFMYGKNGLNRPLINDRLKEILNRHGIK